MPSRIDRYIVRQVLFGTLFAMLVLCVVLVLGNIFKEIRPFLVERGMSITFVGKFIVYLLPFTLVLIIPWSFLASVLLIFGKLSSHQEITAMRSSGLGLFRIATPVFVLGLFFSGICLWLNGTVAPHSKFKLKEMVYQEALGQPMRFFDPGVVQARIPEHRVYINARDGENSVRGFHAYQITKKGEEAAPQVYFYANEMDFEIDRDKRRFDLRLKKAYAEFYKEDGTIERVYADEAQPWIIPYAQDGPRRIKPDQYDNAQIRDLLNDPSKQLAEGSIKPEKLPDFAFERIRRYSFSFAPLALAVIAIPLALQSRRRESSAGLAWTIFIAFAYFIAMEVAEEFHEDNPAISPFTVWLPNIVCLALGLFLFRRAAQRS